MWWRGGMRMWSDDAFAAVTALRCCCCPRIIAVAIAVVVSFFPPKRNPCFQVPVRSVWRIWVIPVLCSCRNIIRQNIWRNGVPAGIPENPARMHNLTWNLKEEDAWARDKLQSINKRDSLSIVKYASLGRNKPISRSHPFSGEKTQKWV